MKKICIYACMAISISLTASTTLAKPAPLLPLKYNLPIVSEKEATTFKELDRRAARFEDKNVMRIDENVSVGHIRQPRDNNRNDWHRNKGGFGLKGEWRF